MYQSTDDDLGQDLVDRTAELTSWVDFCYQMKKRGVMVFAYANNHYAGHAPATIKQFQELRQEGTARDWIATTSKEGSFTIRLIQRLHVAIHVRRTHMIAAVIAPAARSTGLIGWFNRLDMRATASSTPAMINDNAIKIPACVATDLSVMITSLARIIH